MPCSGCSALLGVNPNFFLITDGALFDLMKILITFVKHFLHSFFAFSAHVMVVLNGVL